jgi:hypothetical protein
MIRANHEISANLGPDREPYRVRSGHKHKQGLQFVPAPIRPNALRAEDGSGSVTVGRPPESFRLRIQGSPPKFRA